MNLWQAKYNPKTHTYTHSLKTDSGHSLLVWPVFTVFRELEVSAALYDGALWWPMHVAQSVHFFEVEHGVDTERWDYNLRQWTRVLETKKRSRGEHRGFSDVFVPVLKQGQVVAALVAGPFQTSFPTARDVLARFRNMTGRKGHLDDPEFTSYLRATFSTLVLAGSHIAMFERLLECMARLIAGEGRAVELANVADADRVELGSARLVDRTWAIVHDMLSSHFSRGHYRASRADEVAGVGVTVAPDLALVGLSVGRKDSVDPVELAVRRHAFQRAAVGIARATGHAVSGRVGEHGVVFLSSKKGSVDERRKALVALARRAASVARDQFDLAVHFGASIGSHSVPLVQVYRAALGAAESALQSRASLVFASPQARRVEPLRRLREELSRMLDERPSTVPPHFEGYLQAVTLRSAQLIALARPELELCFEGLSGQLLHSGGLDPKSFAAVREALDRAIADASSVTELCSAFRTAVSDVCEAAQHPVVARQDRSLRGAVRYVQEHLSEAVSLEEVARAAGFASKYFSRLFHEREGVTFAHHLARVRIDRAKELLSGTDLSVTRVAELTGYRSPQYFCRVFNRDAGKTPLEYRHEVQLVRRVSSANRKLPKYKARRLRGR